MPIPPPFAHETRLWASDFATPKQPITGTSTMGPGTREPAPPPPFVLFSLRTDDEDEEDFVPIVLFCVVV